MSWRGDKCVIAMGLTCDAEGFEQSLNYCKMESDMALWLQ